ncbi:MAG: IS200/IS605 family transposase [candidate division SR1 bacterium CG_4_9_14_3_um_filter_40_9]|nr:MAG: IS200/IS605 family transposase [candidate division SR1 bacterium CG_4_9_14_3_um_filter_40_9]
MKIDKGSHCIYQIRYHMVMCVKYRKRLLLNDYNIKILLNSFAGIAERYDYIIDEVGTDGDHVHVFVGAGGKEGPSNVMGTLKSLSAKEMLQIPEIKKQLWGGAFWSSGGYIGTVGEGTNEEIVRKYIKNQGSEEEKEGYKQFSLFKL